MLFTPHLIASDVHGHDRTLKRPQIWGSKVYLVPRVDCAFRRVVLKGKGRPALLAAKLQLSREALNPDSHVHIVRDTVGLGAGAWVFQKTRAPGTRYLPESLAYVPIQVGSRLLAVSQGFEGQVWSEGALIASRWWGKLPSQSEWNVFIRAANVDETTGGGTFDGEGVMQVPKARPVALRDNVPVFDFSREYLLEVLSPKRLIMAQAVIALVLATFFGAQYLRYNLLLNQAKSETASVSKTAEQILSQRRRAFGNIQRTQVLQSLGDESLIVAGLYGVTAVLKAQGLSVTTIKVQDPVIDLILEGDTTLTIPEIVTRLEAVPSLTDVTVSVDFRNALNVKATLQPFKMQDTFAMFKAGDTAQDLMIDPQGVVVEPQDGRP